MDIGFVMVIIVICLISALFKNEDKVIYFLDQLKLSFIRDEKIGNVKSDNSIDNSVDVSFESSSLKNSVDDELSLSEDTINETDLNCEDSFYEIVNNNKNHPSVETGKSYIRAFQVETTDKSKKTLLQYTEGFAIKVNGVYKALKSNKVDKAKVEALSLLEG